ncbi:MAG TPA: cytochrome c peroxidase [Hyphomicrobiales bacterium]|nr:cytochrome c peroxidase [Hyphomicrobiales bacterium]
MFARQLAVLIVICAFIPDSQSFSQGILELDKGPQGLPGRPPIFGSEAPSLTVLGERLFFDPRLSKSGRTSCATCHNPAYAFAEPRPTSIFDGGRIGPRNAPSILTSAFYPTLMWDGRFASLEQQISGPLSAGGEMGNDINEAAERLSSDPLYWQLFLEVFNEPPTPRGIARALAAFERSLVTGWSRFDRFWLKVDPYALTDFERFGFDLFTGKAGCVACHRLPRSDAEGYALFTDFRYHNIGVGFYRGRFVDRGLGAITRRPQDLGAFRTPSLRNVAVTAPYMHDGSLPSLREVIEFYNAGGVPNPFQARVLRPLGLEEDEKRALVAFLNTLTTEDFRAQPGSAALGPH